MSAKFRGMDIGKLSGTLCRALEWRAQADSAFDLLAGRIQGQINWEDEGRT